MPDEDIRREQARAAIRNRKLPTSEATRTWGGKGLGALCVVCGVPVTSDEMEIEAQFAHDGASPGLDKFTLHVRCFAAWELERTKVVPAD